MSKKKKDQAPEAGGTAVSTQPKAMNVSSLDSKYITRLTVTLLAICAVTALLLGVVNQNTAPIITQMQEEKTRAAMAQVLAADSYEPLSTEAPGVTALYRAVSGGKDAGYVAEVATNGFGGEIDLVVGIDASGAVTGVAVTKQSETQNIGSKVVSDQAVLDRFIGMGSGDGPITVNSGSNRFDGVSGATVSSKGVTAGVNAALDAVKSYQ